MGRPTRSTPWQKSPALSVNTSRASLTHGRTLSARLFTSSVARSAKRQVRTPTARKKLNKAGLTGISTQRLNRKCAQYLRTLSKARLAKAKQPEAAEYLSETLRQLNNSHTALVNEGWCLVDRPLVNVGLNDLSSWTSISTHYIDFNLPGKTNWELARLYGRLFAKYLLKAIRESDGNKRSD